MQRAIAAAALVVLAPLLLAVAVLVRITSGVPVLFRAPRISRGRPFTMYKFRTMATAEGPGVTAAGDARVTAVGSWLRRTRLDELPQLVNVVRGEMALVGPRPEDPRYVDWRDPLHRFVFSQRPGITGATALAYRDEAELLTRLAREVAREDGRDAPHDGDVERAYRERILPRKVAMDAQYLRTRSWRGDAAIAGRTIGLLLRRGRDG